MSTLNTVLLAFCEWCNESFFGHAIRDSVWLFPFVEIFHLLALSVLGGALIIMNLRLMGVRFAGERPGVLWEDLRPWILGSIAVMLISGFLMFSTEAVKMYGNWAFQLKMLFLALAIAFTFTIYRKVALAEQTRIAPLWRWLAAVVSVILWLGVGLGGRAIGYVTTAAPAASIWTP
jgi:Family of unknown function (DUF6644)